jgi:hypothetical protein
MLNRREFFKGLLIGSAAALMPRAVRAAGVAPRSDIKMYECGGQTLFPWYSVTGWISGTVCCFPFIEREDGSVIVYGYHAAWEKRLPDEEIKAIAMAEFDLKYTAALLSGVEFRISDDGGLFPFHGEIVRFVPRSLNA